MVDNLVVLESRHTLNLLRVLLMLLVLKQQLLHVVDHVLELLDPSLTHLKLLVSLHKLGLEVVDIVLSKSQLILGVLQLGVGAVEVRLHQLVVQLLVAHLEDVVLLE
jgi:hypothetical protein